MLDQQRAFTDSKTLVGRRNGQVTLLSIVMYLRRTHSFVLQPLDGRYTCQAQ